MSSGVPPSPSSMIRNVNVYKYENTLSLELPYLFQHAGVSRTALGGEWDRPEGRSPLRTQWHLRLWHVLAGKGSEAPVEGWSWGWMRRPIYVATDVSAAAVALIAP